MTVPEEKSTSTLHVVERRSERRILVNVAVEITELDSDGRPFAERSFIEDVSDLGCRFSTRGLVREGDTVAVKVLDPNGKSLPGEEPRYYEIMWVAPKKQGCTVGARLIRGEKLASLKFPPQSGGQEPGAK